jgi:hypothetical protein
MDINSAIDGTLHELAGLRLAKLVTAAVQPLHMAIVKNGNADPGTITTFVAATLDGFVLYRTLVSAKNTSMSLGESVAAKPLTKDEMDALKKAFGSAVEDLMETIVTAPGEPSDAINLANWKRAIPFVVTTAATGMKALKIDV